MVLHIILLRWMGLMGATTLRETRTPQIFMRPVKLDGFGSRRRLRFRPLLSAALRRLRGSLHLPWGAGDVGVVHGDGWSCPAGGGKL